MLQVGAKTGRMTAKPETLQDSYLYVSLDSSVRIKGSQYICKNSITSKYHAAEAQKPTE